MNESPYKLSRASMRKQYGPRAIDARVPSKQDGLGTLADTLKWGNTFSNFQTGKTTSGYASRILGSTDPSMLADTKPQVDRLLGRNTGGSTVTDSAPLTGLLNDLAMKSLAAGPNPVAAPAGTSLFQPSQQSIPWTPISDMKPQSQQEQWDKAAATSTRKIGEGTMTILRRPTFEARRIQSKYGWGGSFLPT